MKARFLWLEDEGDFEWCPQPTSGNTRSNLVMATSCQI